MQSTERLPAPQRRQQILDTALELFAERGYSATSTRALAQRLGVSEALIFRYFATKRDILLALISSPNLLELEEEIAHIAGDPHKDVEARWVAGITALLRYLRRNQRFFRIIYDEAQRDREVANAYLEQVLTRLGRTVVGYFQESIDRGEHRRLNAGLVATAVFGTVFNLVVVKDWLHIQDGQQLDEEQMARELADIFLYGVLPSVRAV
ncbi:MAG: TetR/AcrR family transcriptional regulator [Chloroflexota bacterium]|nr:TetR/AcrR family transcriptional regulator [Chloroflexota bacterium]